MTKSSPNSGNNGEVGTKIISFHYASTLRSVVPSLTYDKCRHIQKPFGSNGLLQR
jgi:hypothetical protein